jgi:chitin synthase
MNIHSKKSIILFAYILFNLLLIFLLCLFFLNLNFNYGWLFGSFFIFGSHIRDFISIIFQLFNIKKLIIKKDDIDIEISHNLCCLVPVYKEEKRLVMKNIKSLCNQKIPDKTKLSIIIICDGLKERNNTSLYQDLKEEINIDYSEEKNYITWKNEKNTLHMDFGNINGTPIILSHKTQNCGKKDSLIIGEELINDLNDEHLFIQKYKLTKPDYIYHTDSDTIADQHCLHELLKTLENDKNITGVSGMVRAYFDKTDKSFSLKYIKEKIFYMMQDYQYFFSLIIRRNTESLLNQTVCLPGCVNMIRICDISKKAIELYKNLPLNENNLIQSITRLQGTDRRYTTLLLKNGAKLQMNWRAFVYTEPPLDFTSFINQRRRWSSNAFFNSIILLYNKNIKFYIKFSAIIDIFRLFATIFRFISFFLFFYFLYTNNLYNIIQIAITSSILIIPYIYAFIWMLFAIPINEQSIHFGLLFNKILMPFLSFYTITKMFFTATNFSWGKMIQTEKNIDNSLDIEDKDIVEIKIIDENE